MSPQSDSIRASLQHLDAVIAKAEQKLRRTPGYTEAEVNVDYAFGNKSLDLTYTLRAVRNGDEECRLAVYLEDQQDHAEFHRWLSDCPVDLRLDVARLIPDLIEDAVTNQADFAEQIDSVASEIEQAVAMESDEYDDESDSFVTGEVVDK